MLPPAIVAATVAGSPASLSPLETLTNNRTSMTRLDHSYLSPADAERRIHRSPSFARRRYKLGSSESTVSDHSSIYNAELVRSDEDLTAHTLSLKANQSTWQLPPPIISVKTTEYLSSDPIIQQPAKAEPSTVRSPPIGHSRWPAPRLDTIQEQIYRRRASLLGLRDTTRIERRIQEQHHSIQTPSSPGARLRASPERRLQVITAKYSIESIHPQQLRRPAIPQRKLFSDKDTRLVHQRSRSLNDLETLEKNIQDHRIFATSSSSTDVSNLCLASTFPVQPPNSPPKRSATPSGLPSFGTREALEYRLIETPPPSRRTRFLSHLLRASHESEGLGVTSSDNPSLPENRAENKSGLPSTELLRRLLAASGIPRLLASPPRQPIDNPRSSLPPGISTANSPGILAMADDGTPVRGRFGNRASGHGIGSRPLQEHPLARRDLNNRTALDEAIRDIDKACADMQPQSRSVEVVTQSTPAYSPPIPGFVQLERPLFNQNQSQPRPPVVGSDPVLPSLRLHSPNTPVSSPPPSLRRYGALPMSPIRSPPGSIRRAGLRSNTPPLLSSASSMRMQEPRPYAQSLLSARTGHGTAQRSAFEQQRERNRTRQAELTEKLKDYEEGCWDKFLRCCCDYDRRGHHLIGPADYQIPIDRHVYQPRSPASASDASVMHGGPGVNRF